MTAFAPSLVRPATVTYQCRPCDVTWGDEGGEVVDCWSCGVQGFPLKYGVINPAGSATWLHTQEEAA